MRNRVAWLAAGFLLSRIVMGQQPPAAPTQPETPVAPVAPITPATPGTRGQAHNNIRRAIEWKEFDYTCEGGAELTVYLGGSLAKVRHLDHAYLMKQTPSADGNRYSDGKVLWWGKGNGGFLREDAPNDNGKVLVKDCLLDKRLAAEAPGTVAGTVGYMLRMALPPSAVIEVQLEDVSLADAPAK